MKKITALLLVLALFLGCLAACGKDDKQQGMNENTPAGNQSEASQTKFAYKAEYTPLVFGEYDIRYINEFCVSGTQMFFLGSTYVGEEAIVDEITGEPYLDDNGEPIINEKTVTYLYAMDLNTYEIRQLGYAAPAPEEGKYGYGNVAGLTAGTDGTVWFYDNLLMYRYDLPEDFDSETDDPYMYYVDEGIKTVVHHFDAQGNNLLSAELNIAEDIYLGSVTFSEQGDVYSTDWTNIYKFDHQGNVEGTLTIENGINAVHPMKDGRVGVSVWEENGTVMKFLDPATMTLSAGFSLPHNAYNIMPGCNDYEYLYESSSGIFGFSENTEPEKLIAWLDCDVDSGNLMDYKIMPDGTIYAIEAVRGEQKDEYNLLALKQVDASTLPQKQVLTLACLYLDWDVRTMILEFNKSHDDVRIVVADYSQYATEEDYFAGLQKLNTEILSGIVPDLFYIDENMPIDVYAAKGILVDFWPLIDADPEISRDDLMMHFFESISTDGKLYRITDTFAIETTVGRSDVVGNGDSWTLDELLQTFATLENGATIFGEMDVKDQMLSTVIERASNGFVDWENSSCSFNSQEFIDLLNFVNSFPEEFDYDNYDWDDYQSEGTRMRMRRQLLHQVYVSSFDTIQYNEAMTDGTANYIGYPSTDGTGSTFQVYDGYAISSKCSNLDAAWQFVRQQLTEEHQSSDEIYQFPTNKHAFEKYAEKAMTPIYGDENYLDVMPMPKVETAAETSSEESTEQDAEKVEISRGSYWFSEDEIVEYYALTQAEYDKFMALYEKTNSLSTFNQHINNIIREECQAFFAGQKSAEETARLIQDRASLYVFEQG